MSTDDTVFIGRQPICDANERVVGYEILFRASGLAPEKSPASAKEAGDLLINILSRFGVAAALGDKTGFLTLGDDMLESDLIELVPKDRFILQFRSGYLAHPRHVARCKQLRAKGYRLARLVNAGDRHLDDAADTATMVVFDLVEMDIQTIVRLHRALPKGKVLHLIRNVNSRSQFDSCRAFNFDLYQGSFFAHPETYAMNRVDPARSRIMDLFNLVARRADVNEIEEAFKHDVALCYSLLCYINSAGAGLQYKTASIRDAIMLLGYDFLWRWLGLLIFAGVDLNAAQRVLLNTAVIRGRLTEMLGKSTHSQQDGNALFLVGMFSMLDVLLGIPLASLLERLQLPSNVARALLQREGPFAPFLELALAFEGNNLLGAERLCRQVGLGLSEASQTHLAAIEWAEQLAP